MKFTQFNFILGTVQKSMEQTVWTIGAKLINCNKTKNKIKDSKKIK